MGDIVNLRQARKRAARAEQEKQAAANRAKFGMTKAERAAITHDEERIRKSLDGAKKDDPSG
ncbi:MAG TPA: DUF4169 family protein [Alphaproteobacteria bacterium]|jgi:hypothetical protein|nr:DUF4169 family protein [Alphaproteobacteria bacterium]